MTKALAIPVGATRIFPGFRGSVQADGSFSYVPPPETAPDVEGPTYADLGLEVPEEHRDRAVHLDPEFPEYPYGQAYTYGVEATTTAGAIRELSAGDVLFFYATLDYAGDEPPAQPWVNPYWGAYLIGHFELVQDPLSRGEVLELPAEERELFDSNAHLRRSTFDAQVLAAGHPDRSQLYDRAVPLCGPEDPSTPNRIVTELSSDSGDPGWQRRLMFFDPDETQQVLAGIENEALADLVAPDPEPATDATRGYLVLDEAPGARRFSRFLELPEDLFELSEWVDHHVERGDREAELFAALAFVAAGWSTAVLEDLWHASIQDLATAGQLSDQVTTLLQGAITDAGPAWPHPIRHDLPDEPGRAAEAIASTFSTLRAEVPSSLRAWVGVCEERDEPAHAIFRTLVDRVHGYDERAAFHQLRAWYHVLGLEAAGPDRLRPAHLQDPQARRGFEAVFGRPIGDLDPEHGQACLDELVEHAERALGCPRPEAVFEVQAALSAFQEVPDDEPEPDEDGGTWRRILGLGSPP